MLDMTRKEFIINDQQALTLMPIDGTMEIEIEDQQQPGIGLSWVYITPEQARELVQFVQEWLDHGKAD